MNCNGKVRLLILDSHPVQYRTPLYRFLASQHWLELSVWYGDNYGVVPRSSGWGISDFTWDVDQLAGYDSRFLKNLRRKPDPSTFFGKINPGLLTEIGKKRPDAVLIFGYASLFHWFSFIGAWRGRILVLYMADSNLAADPGGWKGWLKHALLERLFARIDAFLFIGSMNMQFYECYGVPKRKCFFAPYSVDNSFFRSEAEKWVSSRVQIRESWGVQEGKDVLLFVGRLIGIKRPEEVLLAASKIDNTHVVFCGSGPLECRLKLLAEELIPGRSTFLGFQNQGLLPAVYASSDLLVLPSSYEPWGLVVNEAMASGLPAVASIQSGSAHDLLPEEFRFESGDTDGLVRAILSWRRMRDQEPGRLLEWFSRKIALYSFENVAIGFKDALGSCLRS